MSDSEEMQEEDTQPLPGFGFSIDLNSLKQGAEAKLTECLYLGRKAIIKERFNKTYRHATLDARLNKSRTRSELRGIMKAKDLGISTPAIFLVDNEKNQIIMEKVEGPTAKDWIESRRKESGDVFPTEMLEFGEILGRWIAKMHDGGLIHGDLTTSNIILKDSDPNKLVFIDFGLSSTGRATSEDKGVDLYVLERAIQSTHVDCQPIFKGFMKTYVPVVSHDTKLKYEEIRLRGRKRDMIG